MNSEPVSYSSIEQFIDGSAVEQDVLSEAAETEIIQHMEKFQQDADLAAGEACIAAAKIHLTD